MQDTHNKIGIITKIVCMPCALEFAKCLPLDTHQNHDTPHETSLPSASSKDRHMAYTLFFECLRIRTRQKPRTCSAGAPVVTLLSNQLDDTTKPSLCRAPECHMEGTRQSADFLPSVFCRALGKAAVNCNFTGLYFYFAECFFCSL